MKPIGAFLWACVWALSPASARPGFGAEPPPDTVAPEARVETVPVPHGGDAADDPAIWIHPTDPEKSLVLGTDKHGGLMVYNMDGSQRQLVSDASRPDNVDVLYGFSLGGKRVDLAVAGCRPKNAPAGVKVWTIDSTGTLSDATAGGVIPVFGGITPYGTCVYHSAKSGAFYFFVNTPAGQVEQYRLDDAGDGKITGTRVRAFGVASICEGCVADDELGWFYLAEENVGIWKFGAEPDAGDRGTLVARVGEHGLVADVEGLTLYCATHGRGYLVASSQENNTFKVYEREGDNHYLLTIDPRAGRIGDVEHTDGITVTSCPTSRQFPRGVFIAQDGKNEGADQNFKLYAWEDIAGTRLIVDTEWSPRAPPLPPAPPLVLDEPPGRGREGPSPEDEPVAADDGGSHGSQNEWAESPPLEAETAKLARPGALKIDAGFEREQESGRSQFNVPFALEYAASRRVQLRLEPILYSKIRQPNGVLASGLGDLELAATVVARPESRAVPGIAFAAEVKIPGAASKHLGSGEADYTADVILSKRLAGFDAHLNLGYTVVGRPPGVRTRNVWGFALAAERRFARFDAVAEIVGDTEAFAPGVAGARFGEGALAPELAGEQFAATLGARYHLGDRVVFSLGASYEHDHAVEIRPGLSVKLR